MGDPAGIGGEITLKAWQCLRAVKESPCFALIGDPDWLKTLATRLQVSVPIATLSDLADARSVFADALPVLPVRLATEIRPGVPDPAAAPAILGAIETAVRLALNGAASAVVTNPIAKSVVMASGFRHPGHTEFLAELAEHATGSKARPVMMMAGPRLRTVPVTIHRSVRDAIRALTVEMIIETARITASGLTRDFGIAAPRLAISGINPHAGENGRLGTEDIDIVAPAVARLNGEGIAARGPLPADGMFHDAARSTYDAALCMLHDQALIPVKTLDFADTVNVTLGLPFVRTSPDHGTAFDIAGTGRADPASLVAALRLAADMATRRRAAA